MTLYYNVKFSVSSMLADDMLQRSQQGITFANPKLLCEKKIAKYTQIRDRMNRQAGVKTIAISDSYN